MNKRLKRWPEEGAHCFRVQCFVINACDIAVCAYFHHLDQFPVAINAANDPALVAKTPNIGQGKTSHLFGCVLCWFFKKF